MRKTLSVGVDCDDPGRDASRSVILGQLPRVGEEDIPSWGSETRAVWHVCQNPTVDYKFLPDFRPLLRMWEASTSSDAVSPFIRGYVVNASLRPCATHALTCSVASAKLAWTAVSGCLPGTCSPVPVVEASGGAERTGYEVAGLFLSSRLLS